MEDIHRRTIQRHYKTLVDETNIYSILPKLLEKRVFSKEMLEAYTDSRMTELERKRELFNDVETRGPDAWVNLLDSLRETGHYRLHDLLKNDKILREAETTIKKLPKTTTRTTVYRTVEPAPEEEPNPYSLASKIKTMTLEELKAWTHEPATKENYFQFKRMLHPPHRMTPKKSPVVVEATDATAATEATEEALRSSSSSSTQHDQEIVQRHVSLDESQQSQSDSVRMFRLPSTAAPSYQQSYETFLANEQAQQNKPSESSSERSLIVAGALVVESSPQPHSTDNNMIDKFMNFSETPMKIVVRSSTRFYDDGIESKVPVYRMRGKRRGILLLINNMNFVNDCEPRRNGAHVDEQNITDLFEQLGFEICRFRDLTLARMRQVIKEFASAQNEQLHGVDSVFLTIMSHGYSSHKLSESSVVASDGLVLSTSWIIEQFSNENCPLMQQKPKVFLFQACRGENMAHSLHRISVDGKCSNMPIRPFSDILIGYCTVPGYQSHRDTELGAWYIQVICDVFMNHAHDTHVEDLLKIVDHRMTNLQTIYGTMQTSMYENWGFKLCYLHPNFYASGVVATSAANANATVPYTGTALASSHTPQLS